MRKLPITQELERAGNYVYDDRQLEVKYDDPDVGCALHLLPPCTRSPDSLCCCECRLEGEPCGPDHATSLLNVRLGTTQ